MLATGLIFLAFVVPIPGMGVSKKSAGASLNAPADSSGVCSMPQRTNVGVVI